MLLEGTEGVAIDQNLITRCDGNAIFLSNYNRHATISGNDISWTGDNAMSAFGSMGRCLYANCSVRLDYPSGVDGRSGNQPRYTRVVGNFVTEVGIWQKQSGAWSQHLAAATHIESNVFMNGPHSAVDFNDGFGGSDTVVGVPPSNVAGATLKEKRAALHGASVLDLKHLIDKGGRILHRDDGGLVVVPAGFIVIAFSICERASMVGECGSARHPSRQARPPDLVVVFPRNACFFIGARTFLGLSQER